MNDDAPATVCFHTPIKDAHRFDKCDSCPGCHWCGLLPEEHEGDLTC